MTQSAAVDACTLLNACYQSVLSTLSLEYQGYPFGSVAPFCLDASGQPLLLISDIAQHTKNLKADARASMIVFERGDDIQSCARLTLLGRVQALAEGDLAEADIEAAAERYYRYFPQSRDYHRTHDFRFYRLQVERCRFIGGFGRIHWLEGESVSVSNPFDAASELRMVQHMNVDHADALRHYCALLGLAVPEGASLQMAGIDAGGCHLLLGPRVVRLAFDQPVSTAVQAREALVALARRALP